MNEMRSHQSAMMKKDEWLTPTEIKGFHEQP